MQHLAFIDRSFSHYPRESRSRLRLASGDLGGGINDLSLGNGRDLAVFCNAASALRAVQSGVSPGSENPDTCRTNVAYLITGKTALGEDLACFG